MNVLVIADIHGRVDQLHIALERGRSHTVDAVFVLGGLTDPSAGRERPAAESLARILDELDEAHCPVYLLPGPQDLQLEPVLDALQTPNRTNPIILIHRIVARCKPPFLVAGHGGLVGHDEAPEADLLRFGEQALLERFEQMAAYNPFFQNGQQCILLFATAPQTVEPGGSAAIAQVISQYGPRLVCFRSGDGEPVLEMQDRTLLVSPGALSAGRYAIVNVARLDVEFAHVGIVTELASGDDRRILVPLDGFSASELILPQVVAFAKKTASAVCLLHVLPKHQVAHEADAIAAADSMHMRDQRVCARYYLDAVARRLRGEGLVVATELLRGDPATSILIRLLRAPAVQLVALASNTRHPQRQRRPCVGVVEQLLSVSPIPLLLLQPELGVLSQPHDYHTLLIALDGTVGSEQALDYIHHMGVERSVSLVLLAVAPEPPAFGQAWEDRALATLAREKHDRLSLYLKVLAHRLTETGFTVRVRLVTGQPDEQIPRIASEEEADLIVMAKHGANHIRQVLPGSTALEVIRTTTLPVLLIRSTSSPRREVWETDELPLAVPQQCG